MSKGERTRQEILNAGMLYSSQYGLADITIGTVSKLCDMSRTGVISHFKNKEDMQIAILEFCENQFIQQVIIPTRHSDPVRRIEQLMLTWLGWVNRAYEVQPIGCPLIKTIVDFQDRPDSDVRQVAIKQQQRYLDYLTIQVQKAIDAGKFKANCQALNTAYELYSLYLGQLILRESLGNEGADALYQSSIEHLIKQNLNLN